MYCVFCLVPILVLYQPIVPCSMSDSFWSLFALTYNLDSVASVYDGLKSNTFILSWFGDHPTQASYHCPNNPK